MQLLRLQLLWAVEQFSHLALLVNLLLQLQLLLEMLLLLQLHLKLLLMLLFKILNQHYFNI